MPARLYHCKTCDRHIDECGPLSQRFLCEDCSWGRQVANNQAMIDRRGPYYHRWLVGMVRRFGPELRELPRLDE